MDEERSTKYEYNGDSVDWAVEMHVGALYKAPVLDPRPAGAPASAAAPQRVGSQERVSTLYLRASVAKCPAVHAPSYNLVQPFILSCPKNINPSFRTPFCCDDDFDSSTSASAAASTYPGADALRLHARRHSAGDSWLKQHHPALQDGL
jgi:hypothetical protein